MRRLTLLVFIALTVSSYALAVPYGVDIFIEYPYGNEHLYYCTPMGNGSAQYYPKIGVQIYEDGIPYGYPLINHPPEYIRLFIRSHNPYMPPGPSRLCGGVEYIEAEGPTNQHGTTYFPAPPYPMFGPSIPSPYGFDVEVYNTTTGQWERFYPENGYWGPCKAYWVTPDLVSQWDGCVNLVDLDEFTELYFSGEYHHAIDFFYDGVIDIQDLSEFATAWQECCSGFNAKGSETSNLDEVIEMIMNHKKVGAH